jgi:hypothetical protein
MRTCRLVQLGDDINHHPAMRSCDSRICATFEKGGQKITMFLTLWTPIRRQLLEYAVVFESTRW